MSNASQKMVSADVVAVLLMAMDKTFITKAQFEMMSALDGTRTASGFEHFFRPITAKAKELKKRINNGEKFVPVAAGARRAGAETTPTISRKRKANTLSDNDGASFPAVRKEKLSLKAHAEKSAKKPKTEQALTDDGEEFSFAFADFVNMEQHWENSFV